MPTTLTLTPTGQVLTVPTSWADVPLGTFVALLAPEPDEPRTAAELLLGLEASALDQLAAGDVQYIANLLQFSQDVAPVTELLPTVGLPDVGALPYGCLLLCQAEFERNADRSVVASMPYVLAVYRCQLTYGSTDRVAQVLAAVLAAPVTEVWADAQAFTARCTSWPSSSAPMTTTPATTKMPSWMRAWKRWLKSMAPRFRSMRWRAATF